MSADSLNERQLSDIFTKSSLHQTALWTLHCELSRKPLEWTVKRDRPGFMVKHFVYELLKSFITVGYAVWKVSRKGKLIVAAPETVSIKRSRTNGKWIVTRTAHDHLGTKGWNCTTMVEPSSHIMNPKCTDWPSPTILSYTHYQRVQDIEENWLRRDTHNSFPSVFTAIDLDHIRTYTGSDRKKKGQKEILTMPHMAGGHGSWTGHQSGQAADRNLPTFDQIAKSRFDAVRTLSEQSTLERQYLLQARDKSMAWDPMTNNMGANPIHEEHMVEDGRKMQETKVLLSTLDARLQYDRCRHAVLFALGVPPQAVGETVNSERTASSAAIYDVAIGLFLRTVRQYRLLIEKVLQDATTLDDGSFIRYAEGVSGIQLNRVVPLVKTNVAVQLLAQSYDLPVKYFDVERVKLFQQDAFASTKSGQAEGKGPQRQLETVAATPSQRGQGT